jgi:recombination protein RecA
MTKEEKLKKANAAVATVRKTHGEGSIIDMSKNNFGKYEAIPTGSLGLDIALGIGGLPKGRIVEIYGSESSGKSTLCQHIIAESQKRDGICAYIDVEHSIDSEYATTLGVNIDELHLAQPNSTQEVLNIVIELLKSNAFDVIVIDSVAALVPQEELDDEVGASKMGVNARLMGQGLRKIVPYAAASNTLVIYVNQLRDKLGVMYGSPETTPGGNALKFAASVRLDIRRKDVLKVKDEAVGIKVKVSVRKNKVGRPFKSAEFDIYFGRGIDQDGEILEIAIERDIVHKGGAWLAYKDLKIQGSPKFQELMNTNPELREEIKELVLQSLANDN